ncbi:MAG: DUF47 domain-containing protein [Armatimonadetes bacterium]|nr:DUF47 domain-containing protein [Armatimonadota bacterium]
MFRLLPREETFYDLFIQAARNVKEAARHLEELMDNADDIPRRAEAIKVLEDRGDDLTHEILDRLNRTFVAPLDREDIFALAKELDDIVDWIEAVADRMAVYKITRPTPQAREMAHIVANCAQAVAEAIDNLRHLERITGPLREINRLENLADRVLRESVAQLFEEVKDPIEVIKWKEVYETLEVATDMAENVAHVLEGIVSKNL